MKHLLLTLASLLGIFWLLNLGACQHAPWIPDGITPIDSTENPCDPDSVYFETQILPILQSNCAMSGCHDAATAEDGVILTTYDNVMNTAKVEPFDLNDSELYEVLVETDPDKMMPPPPNTPLSAAQTALIAKWINQGAKNLTCDENAGVCDTTNMSFANDVMPILTNKCVGCHSGSAPAGGIGLENYTQVRGVALSGQLYGVIAWGSGFQPMPKGGNQLPVCEMDKIKAWIDAGAPNN